jgi:hypothetical protein
MVAEGGPTPEPYHQSIDEHTAAQIRVGLKNQKTRYDSFLRI